MLRLILFTLFALSLSSCVPPAGEKTFKEGQVLETEGKSVKAIQVYRKALQENPKNHAYLNALTALEEKYLQQEKIKTEKELEDIPLSATKINTVEEELNSLAELFPSRTEVTALQKLLQERKAESIDAYIRRVDKSIKEDNIQKAEENLAELLRLAPESDDTKRLEKSIRERKLFLQSEAIKADIDAENYAAAHEKLELLKQETGGENPLLQELQDLLLFRDSYFNYYQRGNLLFHRKRYREAKEEYVKALRYDATDKNALRKIEEINTILADDFYFKGKAAVIRKKGMEALLSLKKAKEFFPDIVKDKGFIKVWERLLRLFEEYRKEAISRKEWGVVYAIDDFIMQEYPERRETPAFRQEQSAFKRSQQDAVPLRFGILPFSDSAMQQQYRAKLFTDLLFSRMYPLEEASFDIIAPDQLLALFPPDGKESKGLFTQESFSLLEKEASLELLLTGKVLYADVRSIDSSNTDLKKIPVKVQEGEQSRQEMKIVEIKSGTVTKRANLSLLYTLYDLESKKKLLSDALDLQEVREDSYRDGFPEEGIQADPLDIPTDSAMMMLVLKEGADRLKDTLSGKLGTAADYYLQRGEGFLKEKAYNKAIRDFYRALWSQPAEEQKKTIQSLIHKALEQIFLPAR